MTNGILAPQLPLTAERLRELLDYDPDTGVFTWLICANNNGAIAGSRAGALHSEGYFYIGIGGKRYFAHRLAWLYMTGKWPEHDIDHRDGNRSRNVYSNLRSVTRSVNLQNQRQGRSNNSTGRLGVTRKDGGFAAQISVNGKHVSLGTHATVELASAAYVEAKRRLHEGCTL